MSAWPEAVWLMNEMNKALNVEGRAEALSQRLSIVENRFVYLSSVNETPMNASVGSVWAKIYNN